MAHGPPILLTPVLIGLKSPEFDAIAGWPFADPFVRRLLQEDIPQPAHCFGIPIKYVSRSGIGHARTVPMSQW